MSGIIHVNNGNTHYTITHPDWTCGWILRESVAMERYCDLRENVDPLDPDHNDKNISTMLSIFDQVSKVVKSWIKNGDKNAHLLLDSNNIPSYLLYIEKTIGTKFQSDSIQANN